ncbi:hypothetical protein HNR06_001948 [Nocardiopsis arvandica]|uniref:Uncharacterized protein n=1 Tax=Nocardiopsis sinuspersici TaxID=501010 RepID=A0A7Y9XAS1_9ACTN|nr:hypothetical protein [Nocardiopsis sinuspersici]NYH52359.1 hypothetical protein [Nocardiopsis sinuspersici]
MAGAARALAGNWDSLPMAAWFGEDPAEEGAPAQEPGEEQRRPGPVGKEPQESASPSDDPSEEASESPGEDDGEEEDGDGSGTAGDGTITRLVELHRTSGVGIPPW